MQTGVAIDRGVTPLLEGGLERGDIGIVTPYRKQANGMAATPGLEGIEVDTVHKYQGREKDAVIFVTKVANHTRFVDDANLVNVSVSRAKERLVLVAAPGLLEGDGNIAELARYINYQGGKQIHADEPTMFDLLYPKRDAADGDAAAEGAIAGAADGGDTPSEAIVEQLIKEFLADAWLTRKVGFVRNYPLKMFVPRGLELTEAEAEFVDTRAHADFLFFRIIDKQPLAVLEVDGQQHDTPVQRRRDELKDSIMAKAAIPIQRLRTNAYQPDDWLRRMVGYVATLADSGNAAACTNTATGDEE